MKLTYLLLILIICQAAHAQTTFQLSAGPDLGKINTKVNGKKAEGTSSDAGFIISGAVNFPSANHLMVQAAVQYELIHFKINTNIYDTVGSIQQTETINAKDYINYINLPLTAWWISKPQKGFRAGAGLNVGIAVGGKSKTMHIVEKSFNGNTTRDVTNYSSKLKFGKDEGDLQSVNIGFCLNAAWLFSNAFLVGIYSNIGLSNANNIPATSSHVISGGVTVGYSFGKKNDGRKRGK